MWQMFHQDPQEQECKAILAAQASCPSCHSTEVRVRASYRPKRYMVCLNCHRNFAVAVLFGPANLQPGRYIRPSPFTPM